MSIFRQSFLRDMNGIAGVMFATLFTIMVTTSLTRFLGRAATDRIASTDVMPLIAFSTIGFIPILLVLTVFLSILMVLSRAWRDSEMVVWQASGQSLTAWVRPVMMFAVPYMLMVLIVSVFVGPWANRQIDDIRERFEQREDVAAVAPGQFRESRSTNRVFFVESVDPGATRVRNVFVAQHNGERLSVVASRGGKVEADGDRRFLVLEDGRRYDGQWGTNGYTMMEFQRYGVRIASKAAQAPDGSVKSMGVAQLLSSGTDEARGELVSRFNFPISVIVVALLAIPLSYVNPRVGRSINIVSGVLIYFIYINLNGLAKAWVSQGKLPFGAGLCVTHLLILAITAFLFSRRNSLQSWSLRRLLPRRGGARRAAAGAAGDARAD